MITTCSKCTHLYEAGSEEQAKDPARLCRRCFVLSDLLGVVDELVMWRKATEIVTGSSGSDRLTQLLDRIVERAEATAKELRAP